MKTDVNQFKYLSNMKKLCTEVHYELMENVFERKLIRYSILLSDSYRFPGAF